MSQSEGSRPQAVQYCPEHHTRLRAALSENAYRCKKCKALWVCPDGYVSVSPKSAVVNPQPDGVSVHS